jgi:3-oxoacyl-[acyl-carrier-protein] synthase II
VFRNCIVDRDYKHDRWGEFAMRKIQPLWMLKYLPNMAASHISIAMDARGHSNTICQGEASGLIALIEAATVIQRGMSDVVVTGGTGSIVELTSMLYRGNELSTHYNDRPESASRPFERDRDGMVAGEGAGAIVLESAEHAAARGAIPLARIAGWSRRFGDPASEAFHSTIRSGFENALEMAGKKVGEIGCINASAAGFKKLDAAEGIAINGLFPDAPVVAHKSNFGNLGPGTSTVELIAAVECLQKKTIPGTLNYEHSDPTCPVNASGQAVELGNQSAILKSSVSTTGQVAALVLERE